MIVKILGVVLTVASCGILGIQIAASYIKEIKQFKSLIYVLEYMESELTYRRIPLPDICRMIGSMNIGLIGKIFAKVATLLDAKTSSSVVSCMQIALLDVDGVSRNLTPVMKQLGCNLGKFDVDGQIVGIRSVKEECRSILKSLETNQTEKMRSIKTLGVCAGAAVAILLV